MAVQYSIFSVLCTLTRISKTLYSLMMPIGRLGVALCQLSGSWNARGLFLQGKCTIGSRLSSCILLKNMWKRMARNTCAGARINRWKFKNESSNMKCKRPRFAVGAFLYTCGCMMGECSSIISSHAINCNALLGCYV